MSKLPNHFISTNDVDQMFEFSRYCKDTYDKYVWKGGGDGWVWDDNVSEETVRNYFIYPKNRVMSTDTFPEKTTNVKNIEDAKEKVSDIEVVGNGDMFQLLCRASSKDQRWMKSTKAMQVPNGCVIQATTQQGDNVAEALTFVPGVKIVDDIDGGKKLVI